MNTCANNLLIAVNASSSIVAELNGASRAYATALISAWQTPLLSELQLTRWIGSACTDTHHTAKLHVAL